ncbi:MAG: ATP-dependent RecD-like DNA helicase [Lachnospiraceae bacterium]|nr:ATP-dependent RecD-like DNA helicase [Lachnospiraceae bacterium]
MITIKGYVDHIIFRNDENGYTVLNLASGEYDITCVGSFKYLSEGETVELEGDYAEHAVYGEQFKAVSYRSVEPEDAASMIRYLGSGAIKGVGPALATKIVNEFGEDTFRVIEEEPERLVSIKGISDRKARDIAVCVMEKRDMRNLMVFLQKFGISDSLALKIYKRYGNETYNVINENPYRLAEDINGVGFKRADELASRVGISADSDFRIRSALKYVMTLAAGEGNCYLPKDELLARTSELLGLPADIIDIRLNNLAMEQQLYVKLKGETAVVYTRPMYHMELNCARKLEDLSIRIDADEDEIRRRIKKIEKSEKIELETMQLEAVISAVMNGVTVITGGPGTGKTTIINMIIRYFESEQVDISLAAPTGRAAKRMTEATGCEASTIQRMLKLNVSDEPDREYYYEFDENNQLESDVFIIDEMSMADLPLFNALLKAIPVGARLVLVGDINQLPSVGPGAVLKDVIASDCYPVVCLNRIFRQSEQSDIVLNAHRINEGKYPGLDNKSNDFFFLERDNTDIILNNIVSLIRDKLPRYVNASPLELQVLTPMKKGRLGVEMLNPILQKYLNPPDPSKQELKTPKGILREGDKVMQIKNDYSLEWEITGMYGIVIDKGLGVFNGDMGIVISIDHLNELVCVEFDSQRRVTYPFDGLDELEHAYAVTIHKAQGSEYPAVIIPLLSGPRLLFNRNLLYTGVTRAKSCVVLLGSRQQINDMVDNTDEHLRYTSLADQIRAVREAGA